MTIAPLTALPIPPLATDSEAVFNTKADASLLAEKNFVDEMNASTIPGINQAVADAVSAKNAAAASAIAAAGSAGAAAGAISAAEAARDASIAAKNLSLTYAQAAQVSTVPTPAANRFLGTDAAGNVSWKTTGQAIGDILVSAAVPGAEYKPADGSIYIQADYPGWQLKFPKIAVTPPTLRLPDPSILPIDGSFAYIGMAIDSSATYIAIIGYYTNGAGALIQLYKRVGDAITRLTGITVTGMVNPMGVSFSPDGTHLVAVYYDSTYIEVYKRTGDTFAKISPPSVIQADGHRGVAYSPDGNYMAVGYSTFPYLGIYKRNGDTYTKLTTPSLQNFIGGYVNNLSFSGDSAYLAVVGNGSTLNLAILKRSGDTFTLLTGVPQMSGLAISCSFNADGSYLAVLTTSVFRVYKRTGDTFSIISSGSYTGMTGCKISPDARYLWIGVGGNYTKLLKNTGDVYSELSITLSGTLYGVTGMDGIFSTSYQSSYLVSMSPSLAPHLTVMRDAYPFNPNTEFQVPNVIAQNGTAPTGNTSSLTDITQVKAYVKMKEPV